MLDLDVIDDPTTALALLDPVRSRVLGALGEPGSATTVAATIGESRQKVNYHLRALEDVGLVEFVEDRQRRGLTERIVVASARSYMLSPAVLGSNAADPSGLDRLSSRYLIALAGRIVREVADLTRRADHAKQPLATMAIDADIRFANAAARAAFTCDVANAVTTLVAEYHDEMSTDGRWHRFVVASHPSITESATNV